MTTPRILVVDDEQGVLDSYLKVLGASKAESKSDSRLNELENKLFPSAQETSSAAAYALTCCNQGPDAVAAVKQSLENKAPFTTAFLDVRMPPGPDGVWTAEQIRALDPHINIVIVTAYSDISPAEIAKKVQPPEKLLYMQKPFHSHEIQQFAAALCAKWQAEKELLATNERLDLLVQKRTRQLTLTIESLDESNSKYRQAAHSLTEAKRALAAKADDLEGANQALQQMMQQREDARQEVEKKVLFAVNEMIEPYLEKLEKSSLDDYQKSFLKIVRSNLNEITAPFMHELSHKYFRLSPTEIKVASLIRQGVKTKDIAEQLEMTKRNVDFHRDRIREKIGIKNTKSSLKKVLQELEMEFTAT